METIPMPIPPPAPPVMQAFLGTWVLVRSVTGGQEATEKDISNVCVML